MTQAERAPRLIALDWGTTNLRAWLLDASGQVVAEQHDARGMAQLEPPGFAPVFAEITDPWRVAYGVLPAIACGMVGAKQGWREAPYLDCPARLKALAQHMVEVPTGTAGTLHIVPGMCQRGPAADVMRGEETQLVGAVAGHPGEQLVVLLPGTHSKWVQLSGADDDRVVSGFATHMTGEVYGVLRQHSILGLMMSADDAGDSADPLRREAFLEGCTVGSSQPALLNAMFGVRAKGLLGGLNGVDAADYLSGLLIGYEVASALGASAALSGAVLVIGEGALTQRYLLALQHLGVEATAVPNTAKVGLFALAEALRLV